MGQTGFAALVEPGNLATPPPGPPAPNPAAVADMIQRFWQREGRGGVRDVQVRFGEAAWPATSARLQRLPCGALAVEVRIDRHGRPGDPAALRQQLARRGLAIAEVSFTHDS